MFEDFNDLERTILNWFRTHYNNERLSAQIASVKVLDRRWTKVGFYIDLKVSKKLPVIHLSDFEGSWPIHGPAIFSPDIENGAPNP